MQIGALIQQFCQLIRLPRDLLIDVGEVVAGGARLQHLLWIPESGSAQHKAEKDLERRRPGVELSMQFIVGVFQFDATRQQAIRDRVLAGQDVVLDVVLLSLQEEVFAGLLRIHGLRRTHGLSLMF